MSDDILVLPGDNGNIDSLEPRDLSAEQVSLEDARGEPKTTHDPRHAGKTFLERHMEEFERFIFRVVSEGSRASLNAVDELREPRHFRPPDGSIASDPAFNVPVLKIGTAPGHQK
jgi:hypothetical protein